jgi:hypothetical protein
MTFERQLRVGGGHRLRYVEEFLPVLPMPRDYGQPALLICGGILTMLPLKCHQALEREILTLEGQLAVW